MTTRHLFDIPANDPNTPLCHNLLTRGAVVRMDLSNVNCQACLDLQERLPDEHDRLATVTTYRHADHSEVAREMEFAVFDGPGGVVTISDQTARAIASWFSSPHQGTRNLLALAQGAEFSIPGLREEIDVHMSNGEPSTGSDSGDDVRADADYGTAMHAWLDNIELIIYGGN